MIQEMVIVSPSIYKYTVKIVFYLDPAINLQYSSARQQDDNIHM